MGEEKKKEKKKKIRKRKKKKDDDNEKKKLENETKPYDPVAKARILADNGSFKKIKDVQVQLFNPPTASLPSSEAKLFRDVTDSTLSKSCKKLYKILNLDPWNDSKRYNDDDVCGILIDHPETCEIKFKFEAFSGSIYPLSMLCALQASKDTLELAYEAFKPAIKESDLWVGNCFHYLAVHAAPAEAVEYLISKNPKGVKATNFYGRTPLHMGALFKCPEASMRLICKQYPKAAQIKDKEGCTPLHLACESGASAAVIKMLLEVFPLAVFAKSQYDMTPIHFACSRHRDPAVIQTLLVDGNLETCRISDTLGRLPLHVALMGFAPYEVIELLVASAPDSVVAKTHKGELPLDIARRKGTCPMVMELLELVVDKLALTNN